MNNLYLILSHHPLSFHFCHSFSLKFLHNVVFHSLVVLLHNVQHCCTPVSQKYTHGISHTCGLKCAHVHLYLSGGFNQVQCFVLHFSNQNDFVIIVLTCLNCLYCPYSLPADMLPFLLFIICLLHFTGFVKSQNVIVAMSFLYL